MARCFSKNALNRSGSVGHLRVGDFGDLVLRGGCEAHEEAGHTEGKAFQMGKHGNRIVKNERASVKDSCQLTADF